MKLSEKIVFLRKRKDMSQEQLANELDISRQAVISIVTRDEQP